MKKISLLIILFSLLFASCTKTVYVDVVTGEPVNEPDVRVNAFINLVLALDPKGTTVEYDKMVIKNPENFNKQREKNEALYKAAHQVTKETKKVDGVLTKAEVQDIKDEVDDI